jgi:hypothetical protein
MNRTDVRRWPFAMLLMAMGLLAIHPTAVQAQDPEEEEEDEEMAYEDHLPENAIVSQGVFTTYFGEDGDLFFEIPQDVFGKEMIAAVTTTERPGSAGSDGGSDVVVWEARGENHVVLRLRNYDQVADPDDAIYRAVSGMMKGPIIETFEVEAVSPTGALLIDATDLFTTTQSDLGGLSGVSSGSSFVEKVVAFPRNIEVDYTQTGQNDGETTTATLHLSMLLLPEDPMMPRLWDARVGFNSSAYTDYSSDEHGAAERRFIRRHRLEKADPNAAMSDPIEPIVYWIDPATPEWLQPYVVEGVNDWQQAFEAAGFTNAIIGRVAPTPEEDPDFSMEDLRYSVIWWRPSPIANANGGQRVDPRTGEIIRGRVQMYHNVMDLVQDWYFTQVGPLDPRAQSLPLPDSLMGELVQYVVAHEIGHAIGFPHNMKASAMYPADSVRSVSFIERMGGQHVATLMDYSRFNYVAQPEDDMPVEYLIPSIGPYDEFAVKWGYSVIPGADTPEDELEQLNEWAREQDQIPWYRFTTSGAPDPEANTEAVGDEDAVYSSEMGLRNLRRVKDMLLDVAEEEGESYDLLEDLYGNVVSQWGRYNGHVTAIVGGTYTQEKWGTGERFEPVEFERQREAVQFLNDNVFSIPEWMLDREILRRIEPEGTVDRINGQQMRVLGSLMNSGRLNRLIEFQALAEGGTRMYGVPDLMADLRDGIWDNYMGSGTVTVDVYRRNLQRGKLEMMRSLLNPEGTADEPAEPVLSDVRPVVRAELRWLQGALDSALSRAGDDMTRMHIQDLQEEVTKALGDG